MPRRVLGCKLASLQFIPSMPVLEGFQFQIRKMVRITVIRR